MITVFEKEYTPRTDDFDKYNRIKPSAILNLFQDAAGRHSGLLGAGVEEMLEKGYLWVLVRVRFRISGQFDKYSPVRIKTWPLKPERLIYKREYVITSESGTKLVSGSSEWVIIGKDTRKPVSVPDVYCVNDGFCEEIAVTEGKFKRLHPFETENAPYTVIPGFCDIDMNNHVNNTKYADFVLDAINPTKEEMLSFFQMEYRREVKQETELSISFLRSGGEIKAVGRNEDGEAMFLCGMSYNDLAGTLLN